MFFRSKSHQYSAIEKDETDSDDVLSPGQSVYRRVKQLFWPCTSLLFAVLYLRSVLWLRHNETSVGNFTYANGFGTDLRTASLAVDLKKRSFTGGLSVDENNTLYREVDPARPQYAGTPSPEVDEAWDDVMLALEIVLTGDEAESVAGKTAEEPDQPGHWRFSLDVYHSLHCVNVVRKGLDPLYYHPDGKRAYFYRMHVDHCVDYLRQVIQCQVDLTPLYYDLSRVHEQDTLVPIFGAEHTCRDWEKLHEWAMQRSGAVSGAGIP